MEYSRQQLSALNYENGHAFVNELLVELEWVSSGIYVKILMGHDCFLISFFYWDKSPANEIQHKYKRPVASQVAGVFHAIFGIQMSNRRCLTKITRLRLQC